MAGSNLGMIRKLQTALNSRGAKIGVDTSSFWSEDQQRYIPLYHVKQAVWDEDKSKFKYIELFKSTSQIQIVLCLRDLWYEINDMELPEDNEYWNDIRQNTIIS